MAHPVACAAALEVQPVIVEDELAERVVRQERCSTPHCGIACHRIPMSGTSRGVACSMPSRSSPTARRECRSILKCGLQPRIGAQAKARGLLVYPGSEPIDGLRGDHVLLAPAYSIDAQEVSEIADVLTGPIDAALGWALGTP